MFVILITWQPCSKITGCGVEECMGAEITIITWAVRTEAEHRISPPQPLHLLITPSVVLSFE